MYASLLASVPNWFMTILQVVAAGEVLTRGSERNSLTLDAGTEALSKRPAKNSSNKASEPSINLF